jgi:hypothetical protein
MGRGRPKGSGKGKSVQSVPTQFDPCPEDISAMARGLITQYHTHLVNSKFAFLFVNKDMTRKGKVAIATVEKINAKFKALTELDFLITISYPKWKELSDKQQLAVMDHELNHCLVEDSEDPGGDTKFKIIAHDLEEFYSTIERFGLVFNDLVTLGRVVTDAVGKDKKTTVKKADKEVIEVEDEKVEDKEDDDTEDFLDDVADDDKS